MAGNNIKVNGKVDLQLNLSAQTAKKELEQLQKQLQTVANIELKVGHENQIGKVGEQIREASNAAMQLQSHLAAATNVKTGNLDFSKFSQSLGRDGKKLEEYRDALIALGPQGKNAFVGLANSIAKSEIPLKRTNKLLDTAWSNLKKTAGWQMSSSIIHGLIGSMQQAVGYAKDLDRSLNDIRIVTGSSAEQMAVFAQQANKAAKNLSTTTTDYTKASLIYYQQGLSDAEVKARTETTIKMANATGTSAQKVSDQMTAIWNNYDNGSKSLTYYADVMAKLGAETASSTDEISQGLQKFASISQTVGLSYEYAAAALATVTATSRESADVVGNAFKTLFARIQGLQLGETLEDGTDLNKYSQALNKVGISIKTSSGEMKSMDSILDEMGGKWNTLGKDQQMALAQTVAGVRQYTQLINLMNHWDFFKQNVMSAKNSEGTLNSQAAIFAESWQAASNRVRASFEGLWDSLINSDSFITVLDGFASIIGLVEKLVDGLGGAGGTLAMFGGILGKVFTPQIAQSVGEITMGIRQLSPKARKKDYAIRKQWLQGFLNYSEVADQGERRVINRNLDKYAQESYIRDQRRALMTQQELDYDDRLQQKIDDAREEQRLGAAQADAAKNKMTYLESGGLKGVLDSNYVTPEKMAAIQAYEKYKADFMGATGFKGLDDNTDETQFKNYLMNKKNGLSAEQADAYWKEFTGYKNAALNTPNIPFGNIPDTYKQVGTNKAVMQYAAVEAAKFKEGFTKDFWDNMTKDKNGKLIPAYDSIKEEIRNRAAGTLLNIDDLDEKFDSIMKSDGGIDKKLQLMREYVSDVAKTGMSSVIDSMDVPDEVKQQLKDKYGVAQQEFVDGKRRQASGRVNEQTGEHQRDENDKNAKSKLKMEGAVGLAQGASFMIAASQSFGALTDSIHGLIEGTNSFGNVLSSLTGSATSLLMGMSAMKTGFENMDMGAAAASKFSIGIAAATAAVSIVSGIIREVKESRDAENQETMKSTETEKKKTEANKKLIESVDDATNTYKQVQADYKDGKATIDEVGSARSSMVTAASALQDSYGVNGLTAAALSGNVKELQSLQYEQRLRELDKLENKYQAGATAAGSYMKRNLSSKGIEYSDTHIDEFSLESSLFNSGKNKEANAILSGLTEAGNSGTYGNRKTIEDIVKFYDRMVAGIEAMDAAGISAENSSYYRSAVEFVEANRTNIEAYKQYATDMQMLNIERGAITGKLYEIDNIQDFTKDRQDLIKKITEGMDEDSEEYKKAVNAVDTYLGTLSNVTNSKKGNMLTSTQGMEDLYSDYKAYNGDSGINKDDFMSELSALYDEYGNLIFSLDFELSFNGQTMEEAIADQLGAIQSRSNVLTVEVALQTKDSIQSLLGQGGSVTDWNAINDQIRDEKIYGTDGTSKTTWETIMKNSPYGNLVAADGGLNLLPLLTMPESQIAEAMSYYQTQLNNNKYQNNGYIDTAIKVNEDEIKRLNSQNTDMQNSISAYEQYANQSQVVQKAGIFRGAKSSTMFDSEKVTSGEEINTLHATSSILYDYLKAIQGGDAAAIPGLRTDLIEQGYAEDYLSWLESDNVSTELFDALLLGAKNYLQTQDNEIKIGNLKREKTDLEGEKKDYQSAPEIFDIRQEAMDKGVDLNTLNDLSQQYLAQSGFDYDSNISSNIIDSTAVQLYGRPIGLSDEQRDATERVADGKIAKQEGQIEAAQRRALAELETQQGIDELAKSYDGLSKSLRNSTKHSTEWNQAMIGMKKSLAKVLNVDDWTKLSDDFVEAADSAGLLKKAANGDAKAISDLREQNILLNEVMEQGLITQEQIAGMSYGEIVEATSKAFEGSSSELQTWASDLTSVMDSIESVNVGELINGDAELTSKMMNVLDGMGAFSGDLSTLMDKCSQLSITPEIVGPFKSINEATMAGFEGEQIFKGEADKSYTVTNNIGDASTTVSGEGNFFGVRFTKNGGGGGGSKGGGGGGGGEPKKVANKRKSQTVKRYKKNDMRRSSVQSAKKSASTQKDYLYGESKIAQMEKINKLAEKEARITSDRIKESRKYMIEDRENLIKYMQKYGYEAEFDADGFLNTYEEAWGKIHDKIAKLYEDNELTDDEKKLEEDYKIELEELEGALEDYENSLKELQADIEAYEESLYEMYDNKVEQMQHKVEFKIELDEDDISYLDFWIEALGDSLYNALNVLQTLGQKTDILFNGINTYKEGIEDIYALSDDPLHTWATGGLDEVLTQDQIDALRENRDGLMDYMQQLIDLRETIQDKVLDTFDKWQEKLESTMGTIEHYGTVLEHFKNIIDVVGKDSLKLNNQFMSNLQQSAIEQSMDGIEANRAHYESLVQSNAEAQKNLEEAIASGDQSRIEFWEEVVKTTTEEMQSAQDALLTSLENTLNLIAEKFELAMQYAVEEFNESIYAYGGLEGLEKDYQLVREQADLIAEDYDKIYQLSKINRNINKTLSDSNIIAGKQKMKSLQKEINDLQASGVELSKYDLDYLQAKYELRLAEIELENAKNNKDTVRLQKDSEGNWSYIYTSSVDKVEEAEQKYEDALYNMQNLSYEYMEEMTSAMMATSLAMMEEIQALRIQDFDSYEDYEAAVERIREKYSVVMKTQQDELNKTIVNNKELYDEDWKNYSKSTGYKISEDEKWADNYSETTIGTILNSSKDIADFIDNINELSNSLINDLGKSALEYFANVDTAMGKYGTSIDNFGTHVSTTVSNISSQSKQATEDVKDMAKEMGNAFKEVVDYVSDWQEKFSQQINDMLAEIALLIQSINDAIQKSAEFAGGNTDAGDLIGSVEAAKLLNNHEKYDFGEWGFKGNQLIVDGKATTFIEENAKLINEINEKMAEYTSAETGSEERAKLGAELEELFRKYHAFKDIVGRVYDPTTLSAIDLEKPNYTSMDTGGYTGEWGKSGKFAMLHEKELILDPSDTKNFLEALSISRDLINSMIEMNARQASMAFGNLTPASFREYAQILEQQVSIVAEFPNATEHNEIEEAFNNLINGASQYANKYKD